MTEWIMVPENYKEYHAFVYVINHKTKPGYYIGQKSFWKAVRRKPLKGQKRIRKDRVESNWRSYWGSSEKFKEFVEQEGKENFNRIILSLHKSKSGTSYAELMHQIKADVLRDPNSFNGIINVRLNKILE